MKLYYTLIEYTPEHVRFYNRLGREQDCSMQQLLVRGLLEFFNPQDAQMLIDRARLSEQGALLSRLDSGHLWVPYRRYIYFPFFAFVVISAQVLAPFLSIQKVILYDKVLFGSFLLLPFAFIATDLVNELYGYQATKRMIRQSAFIMVCIAASLVVISKLSTFIDATHNNAWFFINRITPKVLLFYAISLLTADTFNAWLFQKIRFWSTNKAFWLRSILSTTVSRIVYSSVTITLFFITNSSVKYKELSWNLIKIIFASIELSVIYIAVLMLPMYLICHWVKKQDFEKLPDGQIQPHLL